MSLLRLKRSVEILLGVTLAVALLTVLPGVAEAQDAASVKDDGSTRIVVDPGDSLWSISSERLGADATPRQIDKEVERIYALNRERIGADPNLIFPGQELSVAAKGEPAASSGRRVADRSGEPVASEQPASKKVAKTPVKTSTTTDPQAEPGAPPALPAAREAVPKAGSLRAQEGDPLTWQDQVASLASSRLFALVIIVLGVCPLALLVWTLHMRKRLEARMRRLSWAERYGKNYTRFDPFLSFEDTLRLARRAPEEVELAPNGSASASGAPAPAAGNGLARVEIFAAARARQQRVSRTGRRKVLGVGSGRVRAAQRRRRR